MVDYGICLFIEWKRVSHDDKGISPVSDNAQIIEFGRPLLIVVPLSESFLDKLPKTWWKNMFKKRQCSISEMVKDITCLKDKILGDRGPIPTEVKNK
ncbi:hypothetical protein Sjap_000671 [Stephania japonica]|uniref:Uncharacterized protein n=1 Tax=Stephania japonica TaxID=461633 RepID=A0AAP0PUA0_9MAGN